MLHECVRVSRADLTQRHPCATSSRMLIAHIHVPGLLSGCCTFRRSLQSVAHHNSNFVFTAQCTCQPRVCTQSKQMLPFTTRATCPVQSRCSNLVTTPLPFPHLPPVPFARAWTLSDPVPPTCHTTIYTMAVVPIPRRAKGTVANRDPSIASRRVWTAPSRRASDTFRVDLCFGWSL